MFAIIASNMNRLFLRRATAAVVEVIIPAVLLTFMTASIPSPSPEPKVAFWQGAYFFCAMIIWLIISSYIIFKDAMPAGQSLMKTMLGLRVVSAKTRIKCRWWQSLLRNIVLLIPPVIVIEPFIALFRKDGRRLGDLLCGTIVVDAAQEFYPKPKRDVALDEALLKFFAWLMSAAITLVIFNFSYFYIGSGNVAGRITESTSSVVTILTFDAANKPLNFGSGFIVNSDGVVATNFHVLNGAERAVAIYYEKGPIAVESLLASNAYRDIALLKIKSKTPHFMRLGDSDLVQVGDDVYTIGSPQGLPATVSKGIISQIRTIKDLKVLQTDAAISRGNSGGPLLNKRFEVIGINSAFLIEGQNLNFAVPINYVKELMRKSKVKAQ